MVRLAIVSTHPIQYYAPLFMKLAKQGIELKVFYTWGEKSVSKYDPTFQKVIEWDIPLLEGYKYEFLTNTASNAGSHHFKGIINPEGIAKISDYAPDVILVFGWAYQSHLKIIRHFSGKIPVWFRGDSNLLDGKRSFKSILKLLFLKWVYSHINIALYVGTNNRHYFEKYGSNKLKLTFAPHSIDNLRFENDCSPEAEKLRKKLNINADEILILFAGKFEKKKDPLILLQAVKELNHVNTHLLFVGNGPLESQLKNLAAGNKKIHFLGFQNQQSMPAVYQSCDIFCLPSMGPGETWGLAINEAMACGKTVLASDKVGCAIDLIKPTINGDIFRAGDKEELKKKIFRLCSHDLLKRMGGASKEIINNWSLEKTANCLITELYEVKR